MISNLFDAFITPAPEKAADSQMVDRPQIVTERGSVFVVIKETEHYLLCTPQNNSDLAIQAMDDVEWMACQGYFLTCPNLGPFALFEKRVAPTGAKFIDDVDGKALASDGL